MVCRRIERCVHGQVEEKMSFACRYSAITEVFAEQHFRCIPRAINTRRSVRSVDRAGRFSSFWQRYEAWTLRAKGLLRMADQSSDQTTCDVSETLFP